MPLVLLVLAALHLLERVQARVAVEKQADPPITAAHPAAHPVTLQAAQAAQQVERLTAPQDHPASARDPALAAAVLLLTARLQRLATVATAARPVAGAAAVGLV